MLRAEEAEPSNIGWRLSSGWSVLSRGDECGLHLLEFVVAELGDEIDAAPHLEGADRLVVLMLDPGLGPDQFVERRVPVQGGGPKIRADALPGRQHIC